ncbi:hypothetical protein [Halobacillus sp. B23F22_1]|uniref:hypothetical protein n=1 Tax=Halobacillus sp. B23F22_1 TaxID=3459514 RepID=UPI00373DF345
MLAAMFINFPYPHERSNVLFENETMNFLALIPLVLLIVGVVILIQAFNKYKVRMILLILIISSFVPSLTILGVQHTVASGIYAVSYDKENSECSYEMIDSTTLETECELNFENHSQEEVDFELEFQPERYEGFPVDVFTLLNKAGPHHISLEAGEKETIWVKEMFSLPSRTDHFGGQSSLMDVNIKSGERERRL